MKMTLDEAIDHSKELSEDQSVCEDCREEHKQLADWLKELKQYKEENQSEKTAEEMFKELGYECRYFKRYIYYTKIGSTMTIVFNLKKKDWHCVCGMAFKNPNKEEEKAIQKQREELGWI